jgi:UDPglucose 6-dehydrogenase
MVYDVERKPTFHRRVVTDLDALKRGANVVISNRVADMLHDVKEKVYASDLFNDN